MTHAEGLVLIVVVLIPSQVIPLPPALKPSYRFPY